jgi:hypothetical protein
LLRLQLAFAFLATLKLNRFSDFKRLNTWELSENFCSSRRPAKAHRQGWAKAPNKGAKKKPAQGGLGGLSDPV